MATRLYFHSITATATGPTQFFMGAIGNKYTASTAVTLRAMNESIGASQALINGDSLATTASQYGAYGRWASSALAAQTIGGTGSLYAINFAAKESNASMDLCETGGGLGPFFHLFVWRPSTGSVVGSSILSSGNIPVTTAEVGTAQTSQHGTITSNVQVVCAEGDVLVCELWINHAQAMGTAYIGTVYFDGVTITATTGAATTSHASYLELLSQTLTYPAGAITGSSNQTVGSITATGRGTVAIVGASTQTVGSITATGRGSVAIVGASTQTIGSITSTADGRVYWRGASTQTIGSITGTAAGTVAITGSSNQTVGSITATQQGSVAIVGASTQTIGSITATGRGSVAIAGASTQTVGSITATGRGSVLVTGVSTLTIGSITGTAFGTVTTETIIHGVSELTIGSITGTAAGTVLTHGASTQTTGSITATGRGSVAIAGASTQTLASVTATQQGSVAIAGASTQTIGSITGEATGLIGDIITGSSSQTIGSITGTAEGVVTGAPPAPAAQPDTGAGSGAYAPRRKFKIPEEAYKDWSLESLYPVEQILSPPAPVDLTRRVVYTPLANAITSRLTASLLTLPPAPKPLIVAAPKKIEEDDDDDEIVFVLSMLL